MKKLIYISILIVFGMTSCIQDYLEDGGVHSAEVNATPYEYLAAHPYHMFDTVLQIVDYFGLKEEMNSAPTLFMPSDFSVRLLLEKKTKELQDLHGSEDWVFSLDTLYKEYTADSVRIYFFQDKIELAKAPVVPTEMLTYSGDGSGYAVYRAESTNSNDWTVPGTSSTVVTKPWFLYMRKIVGDEIDPIGKEFDNTAEQLREQDISVQCQTTGIICTKTGTVLHVLANTHVFSAFKVGNE